MEKDGKDISRKFRLFNFADSSMIEISPETYFCGNKRIKKFCENLI